MSDDLREAADSDAAKALTRAAFAAEVDSQARRKLRVVRQGPGGAWFGLGMSGLIGWSVAVPTVVGAMVGVWLDHHYPGGRSWTLVLLVAGLCIGCANAWHWVSQQDRAMRDDDQDPGELDA